MNAFLPQVVQGPPLRAPATIGFREHRPGIPPRYAKEASRDQVSRSFVYGRSVSLIGSTCVLARPPGKLRFATNEAFDGRNHGHDLGLDIMGIRPPPPKPGYENVPILSSLPGLPPAS